MPLPGLDREKAYPSSGPPHTAPGSTGSHGREARSSDALRRLPMTIRVPRPADPSTVVGVCGAGPVRAPPQAPIII